MAAVIDNIGTLLGGGLKTALPEGHRPYSGPRFLVKNKRPACAVTISEKMRRL